MTDRTPYCHKIRYGITGAPTLTEDEMSGSHAPGVGISPTLIELVYSAARDDKPARISASVTGWWTRFGKRDEPANEMTTHFADGPDGWPGWLAEEARLHDPAAAPSAPAERCGDVLTPVLGGESTECVLRPGHQGSHADEAGTRWRLAAPSAPADEPQFGVDGCTCRPWTRKYGTPRYCGPHETVTDIGGWERGRDCPHHAAPSAPADRDLRDRIAAAIWERQNPGRRYADCEYRWQADAEADADAVLAVLPAPADRAAVLREAADHLDADMERFFTEWPDEPRNSPYANGRKDAAAELRRMADEAQQASASALLLWNEAEGGSLNDGRITIPIDKAVSLSETAPVGDLILQLPTARALRPQLTSWLNDADEAHRPAEPEVFGPDVVAYRHPTTPRTYLCRAHGDGRPGLTPLEADDLEYGGGCDVCGVDVLIPQAGEGPRG
ncbi:hypothetical protein [Streptomyces sp. NPDC055243]|uniref:hypothetical protein n=1 Tax=Streptomyces sp. NPDC055243 TaxID=3365720 RepID=UPI0037D3C153